MVLDLIHKYKDQYKSYLSSVDYGGLYKWQSLQTFQENWHLERGGFKSMYANSFANSLSNDLWEDQFYYPKKAMLQLIDRDSDLIHSMFSELFNENLEIEGRIDRFVYHCDEISRDIMRTHPHYQSHYHDGYRMISVYLAFRYPMQYTIYNFEAYKEFMSMIKAKSVPDIGDINRFFKVMKTVYSIISKDEELLSLHSDLKSGLDDLYQPESLMLAQDFYWFCGGVKVLT